MCNCNEIQKCLQEEGLLIGGIIDEKFSLSSYSPEVPLADYHAVQRAIRQQSQAVTGTMRGNQQPE